MPKPVPLLERFCSHLPEELPDDGCWEWQGTKHVSGYGVIRSSPLEGYRKLKAHRLSWEIHNAEPIPPGMVVRHTCDNRSCVNPSHLVIGTPQDNIRDAVERRRIPHGQGHPHSKLSTSAVLAIHRLCDQCDTSHQQIGAIFDVGSTTVWSIASGKGWRHLGLGESRKRPKGARLAESEVRDILALVTHGFNYNYVATRFNVTWRTVMLIATGQSWPHIREEFPRDIKTIRSKGVDISGRRNPAAKLTEQQVSEILRLRRNGSSQASLARQFGVSPATIHRIITGKSWKKIHAPSTKPPQLP